MTNKKAIYLLLCTLFLGGIFLIGFEKWDSNEISPLPELQQEDRLPSKAEAIKETLPVKREMIETETKIVENKAEKELTQKELDKNNVTLKDAKLKEENWAKMKEEFLSSEFNLEQDTLQEIKDLIKKTTATEKQLLAEQIPFNNQEALRINQQKLKKNRLDYEGQMLSILGESNWKTYLTYYKEYWELDNKSDLSKLYQPLK